MYYINPWVFYIIGLITNIQIACIAIGASGAIIWFVGLLVGPMIIDGCTNDEEKKESYLKTFWKWIKRFPLIFLISVGIAVVTPNEETMYKMLIASKSGSPTGDR